MGKKKRAPAPVVEHRAPDQDAAVEKAFLAGTLPDADRRADEPAAVADDDKEFAAVLSKALDAALPDIVAVVTPSVPADVGAFVYRDKSGKSLGGTGSEGKNGIGAIAAGALPPDAA